MNKSRVKILTGTWPCLCSRARNSWFEHAARMESQTAGIVRTGCNIWGVCRHWMSCGVTVWWWLIVLWIRLFDWFWFGCIFCWWVHVLWCSIFRWSWWKIERTGCWYGWRSPRQLSWWVCVWVTQTFAAEGAHWPAGMCMWYHRFGISDPWMNAWCVEMWTTNLARSRNWKKMFSDEKCQVLIKRWQIC